MDRRIKRTRTAVFNAVLDLMVEQDTSKLTVLELCKRADINKSTFYLHYKSMDDCLQNCFQIIMNGIINISKKINYNEIKHNPQPAVDRLLDEVEKNIEYLSKFKLTLTHIFSFSWRERCQRVKLCCTSLIVFFSKPNLISTEEIQVKQHLCTGNKNA